MKDPLAMPTYVAHRMPIFTSFCFFSVEEEERCKPPPLRWFFAVVRNPNGLVEAFDKSSNSLIPLPPLPPPLDDDDVVPIINRSRAAANSLLLLLLLILFAVFISTSSSFVFLYISSPPSPPLIIGDTELDLELPLVVSLSPKTKLLPLLFLVY